ncbi:flavin monoamine oxidase family protein [Chitinophaga horti]|uniref:Tryptophan 2-monooxygenase n=1 Tax=Chitinophaga horti TaxID=2920382 RepID=A0ABY6IYD6_9BACT|nr:flavin monoamine oxidase family protein [Chitinophaga horti]UYQ92404.1 flavin monoamine oxidase family protein [Chitinophaga horti]
MPISRRAFLRNGTSALATYPAMMALGMLRPAPAYAFDLDGDAAGKHVLILGAGLAGMTAAYELGKLGYQCTILEARSRAGGRCFTVRKGAINKESGAPVQTAAFDEGQYFNAGPSRIPHHHELTLHYCKELGVPLQVYNNINEAAYYFAEGKGALSNKKVRVREIHNDVRGYTAEMLAKAIDQHQLDAALTKEDTQKIIEFLRAEGGLDVDKLYKASDRRGFIEHPGAGSKSGRIADQPHKLADIIASGLMDPDFYNVAEYAYELQMTMFQAIGGMDVIVKALEKKVGRQIRFGCEVTAIHNQPEGVTVNYKDKDGAKQLKADLCICTIPLPVLSNIDHNFSSDVSRAIDTVPYMQTCKIGLQFKRRFWEEDEQIYGGITHTNNELAQIFYPSYDYLGKKGILIGAYNFNERAKRTGDLDFAQRQQMALDKGRLIHPQYAQEFETGFSVCWHKTEHSLGGWALYTGAARKSAYAALQQPDKQVYFAGEHMTYLNAWMAGAFESARKTVADIHARVMAP